MPASSWRRLGGNLPIRCGAGVSAPPSPRGAHLGADGFRHICHSDTQGAIVFNTVAALRVLRMGSVRGGLAADDQKIECLPH